MNKPKAKGTAHESAIVRWLTERGFHARRVPLAGNQDQGDVHLWAGDGSLVVIEAKCTPNRLDIPGALRELDREIENAGAMLGTTIFKAKGTTDVGEYFAVQRVRRFVDFLEPPGF